MASAGSRRINNQPYLLETLQVPFLFKGCIYCVYFIPSLQGVTERAAPQRQSGGLQKRLGCLLKIDVQRSAFWLMTTLLTLGLVKFERDKVYWGLFCFHHFLELNPPKENSWPLFRTQLYFIGDFQLVEPPRMETLRPKS